MSVKKFLKVAISIIIVGLISLFIGLYFGGKHNVIWKNHKAYIAKLVTYERNFDKDDINSLDLDLSDINVKIVEGKKWKLTSKLVNNKPKVNVNGGKLSIALRAKDFSTEGFYFDNMDEDLVLTVPDRVELNNFNIKSKNSQINIEHLNSLTSKLSLVDGSQTINDLAGENLTLDSKDGDTDIKNLKLGGKFNFSSQDGQSNIANLAAESLNFSLDDEEMDIDSIKLTKKSVINLTNSNLTIKKAQIPAFISNERIDLDNEERVDYHKGDEKQALELIQQQDNNQVSVSNLSIR